MCEEYLNLDKLMNPFSVDGQLLGSVRDFYRLRILLDTSDTYKEAHYFQDIVH